MIIYWGRKVVRKKVGRVADYCFVCRDFRPFQGSKLESVGHVYSIPIGSRSTLGYLRTCESCSCTFRMQPETYSSLSGDRAAPLDALTRETHPRILEHWYNRIQLERRARDGQLSADERREFILEPFTLLNYRVEESAARQSVDWQVGLAMLAAFASVAFAMSVPGQRATPGNLPWEFTIGLVFASFFFLAYAVGGRLRRFTKARILPIIAESLRPTSPTAEELEAAVEHLQKMRIPIGKALRVKDVHQAFGIGQPATFAHWAWG